MTPNRLAAGDPRMPEVLDLVKRTFAFMEGRIDPPSSMQRMTEQSITDQCQTGEVWTMGTPVTACIFLKRKGNMMYVGKLAVAEDLRGQGHARTLITLAEDRARALGLSGLELETRVELKENHAAFARMGFVKTGDGMHEGYTKPTFIIMQKRL